MVIAIGSMRLVNKTPYDSRELKDFIYACAKELRGGRKITPDLLVVAKPSYHNRMHGLGWLTKVYSPKYNHQGHLIKLTISVNAKGNNYGDHFKRDLAHLIIHELMHCQGLNHWGVHKLEKRYGYGWGSDTLSFADSLPLSMQVARTETPHNLRVERHDQAKKMVAQYESKVKRYQNLLKKWQKKVKYYEN